MASDTQHNQPDSTPRVYKPSAVHKRRAVKQRSKDAQPSPAEQASVVSQEQPFAQPAHQAPAQDAAAEKASAPAEAAMQETPAPAEAVVQETPAPVDTAAPAPAHPAEEASPTPRSMPRVKPITPQSVQEDAVEKGEDEQQPRKKKHIVLRVVGAVALVIVAALLVWFGSFAAQRWMIHDDASDFQGTWYAQGTAVPVTISSSSIRFNDETSYDYTLDTGAKTISYQFGNLQGQGRYWFSDDRTHLVIIDGKFSATDTLMADIGRTLGDFFANTFSGGAQLPAGDGVIVLSKTAGK